MNIVMGVDVIALSIVLSSSFCNYFVEIIEQTLSKMNHISKREKEENCKITFLSFLRVEMSIYDSTEQQDRKSVV